MRFVGNHIRHRPRPFGLRGLACVGLIAASIAALPAYTDPPRDSEASKYTKRQMPPEKTPPAELNPRMDCPENWIASIFDDQPLPSNSEDREYHTYNYFVTHARKFDAELMAKHTRPELTFRMLFNEGSKYRGEIVRVSGRLYRLTWIGSNKLLENDGVKDLYEAWIFGEHYFSNPTCVVISELPNGLKPAEKFENVHVTVDGYYFKRYLYETPEETKDKRRVLRRAPLVIGRTLTVNPSTSAVDSDAMAFGRYFLPVGAVMVLGMVTSVFALHRWYRNSDRQVRERFIESRSKEFVAPTEDPPAPRSLYDEPSRN